VALGVLLALTVISACDDDPASPPPGECGGNLHLVNLSDPDSVLLQVQAGIEYGLIAHYMNAFDKDFSFTPDPLDRAQLPGSFDDWSFSVEEDVMGRVLADCVTRSVSFLGVDSTVVGEGEVVLIENYTLILGADRYHGEAQFQMRRDLHGDWRIRSWFDRRPASDPDTTWGVLKGLRHSTLLSGNSSHSHLPPLPGTMAGGQKQRVVRIPAHLGSHCRKSRTTSDSVVRQARSGGCGQETCGDYCLRFGTMMWDKSQ